MCLKGALTFRWAAPAQQNALELLHAESRILQRATGVALAGAAALVLVSPLPGQPSIHELDQGESALPSASNTAARFTKTAGIHDVETFAVGSDTTEALLQVLLRH